MNLKEVRQRKIEAAKVLQQLVKLPPESVSTEDLIKISDALNDLDVLIKILDYLGEESQKKLPTP